MSILNLLKPRNFNRYLPYFLLGIIILISFILFYPCINYGFYLWDDNVYIYNNLVRHFNFHNLSYIFLSSFYGNYNPLTLLSFSFDYYLGGESPIVYHLHNLILHLLNILLIFILVKKLFKNIYLALIVSFLFGMHPMHVESVIWISQRKDLLFAMFFLLSLFFYLIYSESKKKPYYYISLVLFIFSLLSKSQAVVLPICLIIIDYFQFEFKNIKKHIIEKIPFIIFALIIGIITIIAQTHEGFIGLQKEYSFVDRIFISCNSFVQYIFKLLIPFNLSIFYPYPAKTNGNLAYHIYIISAIIIAVIGILFWKLRNINKVLTFGFIFFFINIILVLQFINFGEAAMADRYSYISSIGLFIIIAYTFVWLIKRTKFFIIVALLYFVYIGFLGLQRVTLWKDNKILIYDAIQKYPDNSLLLNNMASIKINAIQYESALIDLSKALNIDTTYADAYYNRAVLYTKMEYYSKAEKDYSKVISLNPDYYTAYYNRGNLFLKLHRYKDAIIDYNKTIDIKPSYQVAYYNRGLSKSNINNDTGAIADFSKFIKTEPDNYMAFFNRGYTYAKIKQYKLALSDFDKVLSLNPSYYEASFNRGIIKFELNLNGCEDLLNAAQHGNEKARKALINFCI